MSRNTRKASSRVPVNRSVALARHFGAVKSVAPSTYSIHIDRNLGDFNFTDCCRVREATHLRVRQGPWYSSQRRGRVDPIYDNNSPSRNNSVPNDLPLSCVLVRRVACQTWAVLRHVIICTRSSATMAPAAAERPARGTQSIVRGWRTTVLPLTRLSQLFSEVHEAKGKAHTAPCV